MNSEVVILLVESGAEPYRILSWRDDPDDGLADERARTSLR